MDGSGILDFAFSTTNGIILPNVTDTATMTNVTPATLVFDRNTAKVKNFDGFWKDLTYKTGISPSNLLGLDPASNKGVVIGGLTSTAQCILF